MNHLMPELPEVENVRLLLEGTLHQHVFRNVTINRLDVIKSTRPVPRDRPARLLVHGALTALHRHGKRLALEVDDGRVLEFSLGMSGQLIVEPGGSGDLPKHAHLIWALDHPVTGETSRLIWKDPRRFGGIWAWPDMDTMLERKWSRIGSDALEIEYESFRDRIKRTRRPIKTALLDQGLIAGIGNIYADEALHRAGVRPRRMSSRVRHRELERLHHSIQVILTEAIEAGGSTIQSFKDPRGGEGRYQGAHAVYGRAGEACRTCGTKIRSMTLNGRSTCWCQECQK